MAAVSLSLTACTPDSSASDVHDYLELNRSFGSVLPDMPNANSNDFLIQNFDVKEVEEDDIEELKKFDVSGPAYNGVSAIGNINADTTPVLDSPPVIYLSTYHNRYLANDAPQYGMSKGPSYYKTSYNALVATFANACKMSAAGLFDDYEKYYKNPDKKYVNVYLKRAQEIVNEQKASDFSKDEMNVYNTANALVSSLTGDGGKKDGIISAYAYESSNEAYKMENKVLVAIKDELVAAGYRVIIPDDKSDVELSITEKASEATDNKVSLHLILWARNHSVGFPSLDTGIAPGWIVAYKNDKSKTFSKNLGASMRKTGITKAVNYLEYVQVGRLCGDDDYYACLNYAGSKTPTCLFIIGSYTDPATKESVTGELSVQYGAAVTEAVSNTFK